MNERFFQLLKQFILPYKKYLGLSLFMNILAAILNLFSFLMIIPILKMLFNIHKTKYVYMPFDAHSVFSLKQLFEIVKNDFYWKISQIAETFNGPIVLLILSLFLIIITVFQTSAMYFSFYFMIPIRTGIVRDIRNQIYDKIIFLPLAFFSEKQKGDILARISGDVNEVENSIMSSLDLVFKNPILIFIYLIGMFITNWQLTLFVLLSFPIAGYIMGKVGKQLKRKSLLGQQQWGNLITQVEETLSGLRIIKAFNAEEIIRMRFRRRNDIFRKTSVRIFNRQQLAHPVSELLGIITVAIVLWYGGALVINNVSNIDGAGFIYYLTIFYLLISPSKELSRSIYSFRKGMASMWRIDEILKLESTIKSPKCPLAIRFDNKIVYENIWFKYKDNWILEGVNLEIVKGQTVALIGHSGSGKSTMVDLLPRFYDVQKGRITIDNTDIKNVRICDLRQLMGIVNQESILFNDTYFNNIAFGVECPTMKQVVEAAKVANAYEFIKSSENGFETNIGDRGCKLSGGQKQRISIARAVLKNPLILILDEATSALDIESERLVQNALEKIMKYRTTIIIAHRLSTIRKADLICVMHKGKIVEQGIHDKLIRLNGYYSRLYNMHSF